MVGGYFPGPLWAPQYQLSICQRCSLPECGCWPPWPPWTISWGLLPAGWCTMSQRSHHLTLVSGPWPWVDSWTVTLVASSLSRSQSNRAALGRVITGDSPHRCAADRCAATLWCSHVSMERNVCGTRPWPSRVTEAGSGLARWSGGSVQRFGAPSHQATLPVTSVVGGFRVLLP